MNARKFTTWAVLCLPGLFGLSHNSHAQSSRLADHNALGWYTYNGDFKLNSRWKLHTEYQWRRIDLIRTWQQSLARLGVVYKRSEKVSFAGGYTYFVTFPYGRYPQADQGRPYPEHRTYQDVQLSDVIGKLNLTHRFRLEQRWIGQLAETPPHPIDSWEYQNRVRYQIAGKLPLAKVSPWYLTFFDEVFIGFGRNVGENIFNQNRIAGGLGYEFRDGVVLELVFLNQIVLHAEPDASTNRPVVEYNNGFRLNLNLDLGN